ncbi:MAG: hypothetical protein VKJ24_10325 [Synechococcales bacterium]|nr:hypothetical protein [Synechococcales bacterium]
MMTLETVLQFIQTFEQTHSDRSPYEIANRLRGHTKSAYTTRSWTLATGFEQAYIDGTLNGDLQWAGETIDFGHCIAALADQINEPGATFSDLTKWTGDHTSWAGDIGSAIATYRRDKTKFKSLQECLDRFASNSDHAANVVAYLLGHRLNHTANLSLSQALQELQAFPYPDQIRRFLHLRFNTVIQAEAIVDPATLEAEIRKSIHAYLELSPESGWGKFFKSVLSGKPTLPAQPATSTQTEATELLQGSLQFLTYLIRQGNLAPLQFRPYQNPRLPWLGTVRYDVSVP